MEQVLNKKKEDSGGSKEDITEFLKARDEKGERNQGRSEVGLKEKSIPL